MKSRISLAALAASALSTIGLGSRFSLTSTPVYPQVGHAPKRRVTTDFTGRRNGERERTRRLRQIAAGSLRIENGLAA